MAKQNNKLSVYISLLLRHKPQEANLTMDKHGWVSTSQLIRNINDQGQYHISLEILEDIVNTDNKGRFRFNEDKTKIRACQGHSIPWVKPIVSYEEPPKYLYHGTNTKALRLIEASGHISKMKRHAVHVQSDEIKAWQSAERWSNLNPVVLRIDAGKMREDGFIFGVSDNGVWLTDDVPTKYIVGRIYVKN